MNELPCIPAKAAPKLVGQLTRLMFPRQHWSKRSKRQRMSFLGIQVLR